jgi:hypothetical protein
MPVVCTSRQGGFSGISPKLMAQRSIQLNWLDTVDLLAELGVHCSQFAMLLNAPEFGHSEFWRIQLRLWYREFS